MRWRSDRDNSTIWGWRGFYGRLTLSLIIYRHRYPDFPDRWVFQPGLTYDRKERE